MKLEYNPKMWFLVKLSSLFFQSNLRDLVYINIVSKNIRYLVNAWPHSARYILEYTSSFPSTFTTNISYPFYNYFKLPFPTQFSRHILSNVSISLSTLQLCFQIALLICFVCRGTYELFIKIDNKAPISKRSPGCHVNVSTTCEPTNKWKLWDQINLQSISYNSV